MKRKNLLWGVFAIILFIITVFIFQFRFNLRLLIPYDFHHLTTVIMLLLIILTVFSIIFSITKTKIKNWIKYTISIVSIFCYIMLLTKICTNNRKVEMTLFINKNEKALTSIVNFIKENNIKNEINQNIELKNKLNEMNIRSYMVKDGIIFLGMYKLFFFTYGYGIAYSEINFTNAPRHNHQYMVPYSDWFVIKNNWYYYEWAD